MQADGARPLPCPVRGGWRGISSPVAAAIDDQYLKNTGTRSMFCSGTNLLPLINTGATYTEEPGTRLKSRIPDPGRTSQNPPP